MNFADVLHELELEPQRGDSSTWENWAAKNGLPLPVPFLEALRLGAAQLLTEHSNTEKFLPPSLIQVKYRRLPVMALLGENQGNYAFGLLLDGTSDPPVLLLSRWLHQNGVVGPNRWRPYADSFADFAFARFFDYQYMGRPFEENGQDEAGCPLPLPVLTPKLAKRLGTLFRRGPTTPEVFDYPPSGSRQRFYRAGQRLSFARTASLPGEHGPHWAWSANCASPLAHAELLKLLTEVMA